MFDDKRNVSETIIGPSVRVEGNFHGAGDVVVEGQLSGTLKTDKHLRVGEAAKLRADIEAADVYIAGEVRGNVKANARLELAATGRLYGNVETANLIVAGGAVLHGKVAMASKDAEAAVEVPPVPTKRNHRDAAA